MVSPDTRNNLIVLTLIVAICIIVGSFIVAFSNNLESTSKEGMTVVKVAASNVTTSSKELVNLKLQEIASLRAGYNNLSNVLNKQLNVTLEERETQKNNLKLFFEAFQNQTSTMVNAIDNLKESFIKTIGESQNLTKENKNISLTNQNLTQERNMLLKLQIEQFDELLGNIKNNTTTNMTR